MALKDTEELNRYLLNSGQHDKLVDYSQLLDTRKASELRERRKRIFEEDLEHEFRPDMMSIDHLISAVATPHPESRNLVETTPDYDSISFTGQVVTTDDGTTIERPAGSIYEVTEYYPDDTDPETSCQNGGL